MSNKRDITGAKNPNWKGGLVKYRCEECGKVAQEKRAAGKKRFCSLTCANKYQSKNPYNTEKRVDRIIKKCRFCGGKFKVLPSRNHRRHFCKPDCSYKWRSERMKGEDNINWNGGTSQEPYPFVWLERRAEVVVRDGDKCMSPKCRGVSDRINVHHIDYDKDNCSIENLITLCASCNGRANFNRDDWTQFYRELLGDLYGYEYED